MSDFELFIGEHRFATFTNGWVKRELDTLADSFEFQYADLRTDLSKPVPIRAGDECSIRLRGQLLLTGYIDDTSVQYTADSLTLTARGRSKTGDLVDCSIVRKTGRWRNVTLRRIVEDLCKPFDISVEAEPFDGLDERFTRFAVEPGESVNDAIQRACRLRSCWATCTPEGNVLLTRAGLSERTGTVIRYGTNIISGERFESWQQRHNAYLLKGQTVSDEELSGTSAAQLSDVIFDEGLNRYRPLLLVSTGQDRKGDLRRRAQWEANRRAGSGERWLYRVDGYGFNVLLPEFQQNRRDGFVLWQPNQLVQVEDPRTGTSDELLVAAISYRWQAEGADGGRTTDITLTRKEAFTLQRYPRRKDTRNVELDNFYYSVWTANSPAYLEAISGPPLDPDALPKKKR
jgi:prophage tail gpP-like protein